MLKKIHEDSRSSVFFRISRQIDTGICIFIHYSYVTLLSSSLSFFFLSFFLLPNYCRYVLHKMTSYHDRQTSKEEIVNILRPHKEYLPPLPDALQLLVGQSSWLTLAVHGDGIQLIKAGRHEEISQVVFLSCQRILALRARG